MSRHHARLLTTIGENARDVYYYTFILATEEDDMKLDPVVAKFDEYFSPRKNLAYIHALSFLLIIRQMGKVLTIMLGN